MEGYWCYWHGGKGYSGVGLHVSKTISPDPPAFTHPPFDYETRIATVDVRTPAGDLTVASIYVPNGGKDFKAKMAFLEAMAKAEEIVKAHVAAHADIMAVPANERQAAHARF